MGKLLKISVYVLQQFKNASDKLLPIYDLDHKRWALEARDEINLSRELFTASTRWVHNFKIKHEIVSRKINKFVTRKQVTTKEQLTSEIQAFVTKVKYHIFIRRSEHLQFGSVRF